MIECAIIGDSIAVGVANRMPQCSSYSKGGWNTWQWNKQYGTQLISAATVVISLGTNDHKGVKTRKELTQVRQNVNAKHVVWILPPEKVSLEIRNIVMDIAIEHNDTILPIKYLSKDQIHPSDRGYNDIVNKVK